MRFHDVEIYSGTVLTTTGSRLEIGANNNFLLEIFSGLADCTTCREPIVLIFPEEEESTLREVFNNRLSHFKSGLSVIESKSLQVEIEHVPISLYISHSFLDPDNMHYPSDLDKVNSLLGRLVSAPKEDWSNLGSLLRLRGSRLSKTIMDQSGSSIKREEESLQVYMDTGGEP